MSLGLKPRDKKRSGKPNADKLDKDLDRYFAKNGDPSRAKNSLDMELDEYMKKAKGKK